MSTFFQADDLSNMTYLSGFLDCKVKEGAPVVYPNRVSNHLRPYFLCITKFLRRVKCGRVSCVYIKFLRSVKCGRFCSVKCGCFNRVMKLKAAAYINMSCTCMYFKTEIWGIIVDCSMKVISVTWVKPCKVLNIICSVIVLQLHYLSFIGYLPV